MIEPLWRFAAITSAPPITKFTAYIMSMYCILNDQKARDEMDYAPLISRDQGFDELCS